MWRPWAKGHVETEPKGWVGAFNMSISLSSVFERLLKWDDADPSPITPSAVQLLTCVELTHYIFTSGLHRWQRSEMLSCRPTHPPSLLPNPKVPAYALAPASLPFSTVASANGSPLAMSALPVPQTAVWSFHLPLHRFVSACIREVSRRHDDSGGIAKLLQRFALPPENVAGNNYSTQLRQNALLFRGCMEFPMIVLSRWVDSVSFDSMLNNPRIENIFSFSSNKPFLYYQGCTNPSRYLAKERARNERPGLELLGTSVLPTPCRCGLAPIAICADLFCIESCWWCSNEN